MQGMDDNGRTRADATTNTAAASRRRMLTGTVAAAITGALTAGTALASLSEADADAELIGLCAEFDDCERRIALIYEAITDDDLADTTSAPLLERQSVLSEQIMRARVHNATGIFAIARSIAIHGGNGGYDLTPTPAFITGRLMTALFRESLLLSGLPVPDCLEGRAVA